MKGRRIAFFAMGDPNHFQMLRPVISGIASRGIDARVFTHLRLAREVERAGATFVDLYAGRPLEAADDESVPLPSRYVSFAGRFADELVAEVEALDAELIVYESFSVIAWVAGRILGLPYVNLGVGHDITPARYLPRLESDPRVDLSPRCLRAVEVLRDRYGIDDASPFAYISGISPFLNLHPEPEAFLGDDERRAFEPVAFFGSLPAMDEIEARRRKSGSSPLGDGASSTKLYVSFGTIVWRYWEAEAMEALRRISEAVAETPDVHALIGLGGAELDRDAVVALSKQNVTVERRADQWRALEDADAFLSHQGINSTHEAIFHRVPMISYPFFWDQPALAEKCRDLGVAIPLTDSPLEPVTAEDVEAALAELSRSRERMRARLADVREWELQMLAQRDLVLDRVVSLMRA